MTKRSRFSYSETIAKLTEAMTGAGNTIFATVDQSAAAAGAGLTLRPTTLILFGNPRAGTPLMDAFPEVALELPLRVVVWEDADGVAVAYVTMSDIAARFGVTGMNALVAAIDAALEGLTGIVATV
jgi:uncharacterized protein (DUF302 family)